MSRSMQTEDTFLAKMPDQATENVLYIFVLLLCILEIVGGFTCAPWLTFGLCFFSVVCIYVVPKFTIHYDKRWMRVFYVIYVLPLLFLLYPFALGLTRGLHDYYFDSPLIAVDRFLFVGTNPTQWIFAHIHLPGFIVEVLEYSYVADYLYPLSLGVALFIRRDFRGLKEFRFAMVYGAILSFVINITIPAIGPRFTLHEFANLGKELPGMWIISGLRDQLNSAEGISALMTSKEAALSVLRDAFPSGHTMLTLMTLIFAFRYKVGLRWFLLPLGISLILSTVLLRYHYVIDVISGIVFALIAIKTAPPLQYFLNRQPWGFGGTVNKKP